MTDLNEVMREMREQAEALLAGDYSTYAALQSFGTKRPTYFHRDGTPIVSDDLLPDFLQWAMLFEHTDRHVAVTRTLYGERLSTVYLGMEHGFVEGRALIFETMLFAPDEPRRRWSFTATDLTVAERHVEEERERYIAKHYPHNQVLQLRYTNEDEARERHETLRLQCLIPPRWRHFLLWTIGRDHTWAFYDDEDEDEWT